MRTAFLSQEHLPDAALRLQLNEPVCAVHGCDQGSLMMVRVIGVLGIFLLM